MTTTAGSPDGKCLATAHEGGVHIARQATIPDHSTTGVFLNENGGTYPW